MQVSIFYCHLPVSYPPEVFDKLLKSFPDHLRGEIEKYKAEKNHHLRIAGKALLLYGLKQLDPEKSMTLENYRYSESNKPFLAKSDFKFNLSHSGDLVVCCLTKGFNIGIDVEKIIPVALPLMDIYFHPDQWEKIMNAVDVYDEFYHQWTIKEAALKCLDIPIDEIKLREITIGDHLVQVEGYSLQYIVPQLIPGYKVCFVIGQNAGTIVYTSFNVDILKLQ